jgi:hypothetical protein
LLCAQVDVNVSLTAISLLWNAADLLSKMQARGHHGSAAAATRSSGEGGGRAAPGADATALGPEEFEELLRMLLAALQVLPSALSVLRCLIWLAPPAAGTPHRQLSSISPARLIPASTVCLFATG